MDNRDNYKWASPDIAHILKNNARNNRKTPTIAEDILWQMLRKNALGCRFRRQMPIGDYIADFCCLEKHLVIEVDGGYHNHPEQRREDIIRSNKLNKFGFYVLRFTNEEVTNCLDDVISKIQEFINKI